MSANRSDGQESAVEETKRKFREALEAKKGRRGEDHIDESPQQVHAHGPVDQQRSFHRKSNMKGRGS